MIPNVYRGCFKSSTLRFAVNKIDDVILIDNAGIGTEHTMLADVDLLMCYDAGAHVKKTFFTDAQLTLGIEKTIFGYQTALAYRHARTAALNGQGTPSIER